MKRLHALFMLLALAVSLSLPGDSRAQLTVSEPVAAVDNHAVAEMLETVQTNWKSLGDWMGYPFGYAGVLYLIEEMPPNAIAQVQAIFDETTAVKHRLANWLYQYKFGQHWSLR